MPNNTNDNLMTQEEIRLRCLDLAQVHFKKPDEVMEAAEKYSEYVKKGPPATRVGQASGTLAKDGQKHNAEVSKLI